MRRELYSTAHMKAKCSRRLCLSVRHNASVIDQVFYSITSQLLHIILHVYIHIVQLIKCHVHLANIGAVHTYSYIYILYHIYIQGMQKCAFCYKKSSEPISGAPRPRYRSGIGFQVIKLHAKHHICYIEQQKRAIVALKGRSRRASPPAGGQTL